MTAGNQKPAAAPARNIYLLHGKGGRPTGSVLQLEQLLRPQFPGSNFTRPALLHGDPAIPAEASLGALSRLPISEAAAVIGVSLGGLLASALQETERPDLRVVCISSPTWADRVRLERRMPNRVALYSSRDEVIQGRTSEWPRLAEAYDLPWLTHDTDVHKAPLTGLLRAFLLGEPPSAKLLAGGDDDGRPHFRAEPKAARQS